MRHYNSQQLLRQQSALDSYRQHRFQQFSKVHNGKKPLLVLDVDNTLIFVRYMCEEMRIGDICTYFYRKAVPRDNAMVLQLQVTLTLAVTDRAAMDALNIRMLEQSVWTDSNEQLEEYMRSKGDPICPQISTINGRSYKVRCKVVSIKITGCRIAVDHSVQSPRRHRTNRMGPYNVGQHSRSKPSHITAIHAPSRSVEEIEIDFTNNNDNFSKLEPQLQRDGMLPVDFVVCACIVCCVLCVHEVIT